MTTSGYTLLEPPTPSRRSCTSIPAPRSSAASTGRRCRSSRACEQFAAARARPARRAALARSGRAAARADYEAWQQPEPMPGDARPRRGASRTLRERAARTRSSRTAPATSPSGCTASGATAAIRTQLAPTSGAMGYGVPAAVAAKLVAARAHRRLLRGRRRLPDERPGARDRGRSTTLPIVVLVVEQRHVRDDPHAPGARAIPGASSAPTSSTPTSPPTRAPSARTARPVDARRRTSRPRSSARSPPGGRR